MNCLQDWWWQFKWLLKSLNFLGASHVGFAGILKGHVKINILKKFSVWKFVSFRIIQTNSVIN